MSTSREAALNNPGHHCSSCRKMKSRSTSGMAVELVRLGTLVSTFRQEVSELREIAVETLAKVRGIDETLSSFRHAVARSGAYGRARS